MEAIAHSGYTLPNRLARITLLSLEELIGYNGLQALLNLAHLDHWIENYPPANLDRGVDFSELSLLNIGLEELYGERGGRGIAQRAGRAIFSEALSNFGAMAGTADAAFKMLPSNARLNIGLKAMARIFNHTSDQRTRVEDQGHEIHYLIHRNPVCWGRRDEARPVCAMQVGMLDEASSRMSGGLEFRVDEAECKAMGAMACRFVVQKAPLN